FWRIYTKNDALPPQYISEHAKVERSIIGEGSDIYGEVYNSVIGVGVTIEEGAVVRDSIIMKGTVIGKGAKITKSIIAENVEIGADCELGIGDEAPSKLDSKIYNSGLVTIGEGTVIPPNIKIGKNTTVSGITKSDEYQNGMLHSGEYIIKAGDMQ
ncbi:MAG: glucose-1-phosphate adenylyltransferase, partial [Lachnospiraceae bacterium]|nr:glucose-1-phosphate adenylyltransferase [Lachnospiraceae bacterium]